MIDDLTILSVPGAAVGDLSTERAPDPVDRALLGVSITEVADGRKTDLGGDYNFEQLPALNDQIVISNRGGSYDIMRVLYSAHEPKTTVYVRWVARR